MDDDRPIPEKAPPAIRRCAVCGERAPVGFGSPGTSDPAEAWYCAERQEGEQTWTARYRPTGGFGDSLL
jgi:hypothetical protein